MKNKLTAEQKTSILKECIGICDNVLILLKKAELGHIAYIKEHKIKFN